MPEGNPGHAAAVAPVPVIHLPYEVSVALQSEVMRSTDRVLTGATSCTSRPPRVRRFAVLLAGMALLFIGARPIGAQTSSNPELQRAITTYASGDLTQALTIIESLPTVLPDRDRALRLLYRGLIFFAQGNAQIAEESFRRAVEIDPSLRLDPDVHSPSRLRAFEVAQGLVIASWKTRGREAETAGQWQVALDRWLAVLIARPEDQEALSHAKSIRDRLSPPPKPDTQALVVDSTPATAVRVRLYNPGSALALGLLLPGGGEFYTGSTLRGLVVLLAAGGAAAAGVTYKSISVQCLSVPVDGFCPPEDVISQTEEQPYLVPGLAAAAAITFVGALDAWAGARRKNTRAQEAAGQGTGTGARLQGPSLERVGDRLAVSFLRVRF